MQTVIIMRYTKMKFEMELFLRNSEQTSDYSFDNSEAVKNSVSMGKILC